MQGLPTMVVHLHSKVLFALIATRGTEKAWGSASNSAHEALYHTTLPDQYHCPIEVARLHAEHTDEADKSRKRFAKQLFAIDNVVVNADSVQREAFLRHIHATVDRKSVYSIALTDVDRSGLAPLVDVIQTVVPMATAVFMDDIEMDVDVDDAGLGASIGDERVGASFWFQSFVHHPRRFTRHVFRLVIP
jgi:hypothetical protein